MLTYNVNETHLISADKFIGKREARHQAAFLEPEYRRKRTRKEDSFHGSEGHNPFSCEELIPT